MVQCDALSEQSLARGGYTYGRLRMAVILGEGACAVSDRDTEALAMSFDLYGLHHIQIKILFHLDDVIHLQSSIERSPSLQ